jgi:epoxyqueuosine reductase
LNTLSSDPHQLASTIKQRARQLGFDLVGIAPASPSQYRDYLRRWLDEGQAGTMHYLAARFEERTHPASYFAGAASVICVAMNYHVRLAERDAAAADASVVPGRIARYALGGDYHEIMKERLHQLSDWLRQTAGGQTRAAVDTAPVMEKDLAARAGVGWVGKNTCVINQGIGSWLLLGEILTTLSLPPDEPAIDRCGACRRCLDACPTGAITAPYQLVARKCISYLTIEHRGEIDVALQAQMGDWLYGCDICQDVCPWNSKALESVDPALASRFADGTLNVREVLEWTPEEYAKTLRHSAMKRVKLPQLKRNATIVLNNSQGA